MAARLRVETGVPKQSWSRGKVLGGSSAVNLLVWDRGVKVEYDAWEALWNKGWNWAVVSKYIKKVESVHAPNAQDQADLDISVNPADYGLSGPVQVSFPRYISEIVKRWVPALEARL